MWMNHHLISDSKWSRCCRFPIINVYRSYFTTNVVVLSNSQQIRDPCVFKCTDERRAPRISQSVSQSGRDPAHIRSRTTECTRSRARSGSGTGAGPDRRLHVTITSSFIALWISCCYSLARALDTHSLFSSSDLGLWVCGVNAHRAVHGTRAGAEGVCSAARDWWRWLSTPGLKRFLLL